MNSSSNNQAERAQEDANTTQNIGAVTTLRTIPFWEEQPELWFLTLENQFRLQRTLDDDVQFSQVLAALPQQAIQTIADILRNPPPAGRRYESLKTALIQRYTVSAEKRLNDLLSSFHEMGDLTPSKFYRLLEQKAGDHTLVSQDLLKSIWLKRLPDNLRIAVAGWAEKPIDEILPITDKIWEIGQPSTSSVASMQRPSTSKATNADTNDLADMKRQIEHLTRLVSNMTTNRGRSPTQRTNSRDKSRPRSRSPSSGLCYYHRRFGSQARTCRQPCNHKSGAQNNGASSNNFKTSENR